MTCVFLLFWDFARSSSPGDSLVIAVISAWAKSRVIGKSFRARSVLDTMIDLHESGQISACPNTICFTAVINACAYCENDEADKRQALRIAIRTYKDLEQSAQYGRPNQVTYSSLLTALRNLLPQSPQRNRAVRDVFESAVKNGFVDSALLQRLKCKCVLLVDPLFGL